MTHHLEALPPWPSDGPSGPSADPLWQEFDALDEDPAASGPLVRPAWWRWVAIAVIAALVAAGPVAFVLSRLLV